MNIPLLSTLAALGFGGAFVAGLLGIGGAIIMIPLLLYVPAWLGLGSLDIRTVTAISMVQVFFAALSGTVAHGRHKAVDRRLALTAGMAAAAGSLLGGVGSRWFASWVLLLTFAMMATLGAALMVLAPAESEPDGSRTTEDFSFSRPLAAAMGLGVGAMAGLVGAGGAFLLVPLLIIVVKVPMRITIGSSLAITLWAGAAGAVGKVATGQVPFLPAAALVLGAVPGAQLGGWASRRFGVRTLRGLLAAITALVAVRVWLDVLVLFR